MIGKSVASASLTMPVFLLGMVLFVGPSQAQWQKMATIPQAVSVIKFFSPDFGLLGTGASPGGSVGESIGIFRTTDGGTTWTTASVPSHNSGEMTDFYMMDDFTGWASVIGDPGSGLWKTTDGGMTWHRTSMQGAGTSVYLTSKALVVTDLFQSTQFSTDSGRTWQSVGDASKNCVSFSSDTFGVISSYRGGNWLVSSDGGLSWKSSSTTIESWSVYAVRDSAIVFAAPEGNSAGPWIQSPIYVSADYGHTWKTASTLPFRTTGHIAGAGDRLLFVQECSNGNSGKPVQKGFYMSSDQGATWTDIAGPQSLNDTRFCTVSRCGTGYLYALDEPYPFNGVTTIYRYAFSSPTNAEATQHREVSITSIARIDSLPLAVDVNPKINLDSLWPYVLDMYLNISWDTASINLVSYVPPVGWSLTSLQILADHASIVLHNNSSSITHPLDIGTVVFKPLVPGPVMSRVALNELAIELRDYNLSMCVSATEDDPWLVEVRPESSVAPIDALSSLTVFPNPFTNEIFVETANGARIECELHDALGRLVLHSAGVSSVALATQDLPSGAYTIVLHTGNEIETRRVNKIR
jgi:hypothetical protein